MWTRAHPTARKKLPNRFSRGSQFGYEDFAAFCAVATSLGRPVTHLVRGHDHVEERYAVYPAYHAHPVLTTVALSRRLSRERIGSYERVPTIARVVERALPQVYRLHIPADMIRDIYPEPDAENSLDGANDRKRIDMSGVVLRCPSCGTTRAAPGECDACHEAQVRYYCTNHTPGRWLELAVVPAMRVAVRCS